MPARLLWLNGAPGVGKSTAANLLRAACGAAPFDPHEISYALAELVPADQLGDLDDDTPLWRSTVVHIGNELAHTSGTLVVFPATVYRPGHVQQMIAGFHQGGTEVAHVVLSADKATIAARIHQSPLDDPAKQWCLRHVQPAETGLLEVPHHLRIDTTGQSPRDAANAVARALDRWGWLPPLTY